MVASGQDGQVKILQFAEGWQEMYYYVCNIRMLTNQGDTNNIYLNCVQNICVQVYFALTK